jgi:hypothetical protein
MTAKAFNKIAQGLSEALSIVRGHAKPFKLHTPIGADKRPIDAAKFVKTPAPRRGD